MEFGLTSDGRWPADTASLVSATAAAGFGALGLMADRIDPTTRALLGEHHLRCHEVMALLLNDDEDQMFAEAERLAEAASLAGAPWVLTVFRTPLDDRTAPIIRGCAERFAAGGARMAVEFSPLGSVPTMRAGLDVVTAAGAERAGLVIDTWHFCFGDNPWTDLESVPLERLAYVQFTDALEPESDRLMQETMNRRQLPGEGVLPLRRFAETLLVRGWDGLVSVEVLNLDLGARPIADITRRAFETTVPYWS